MKRDPRESCRRAFIKSATTFVLGSVFGQSWLEVLAKDSTVTLPFENGERPLAKYPQKRELIRLTTRPPQLETPFSVFNDGLLTPNDAFFVRYHLADIPTSIDPKSYRLEVKGKVTTTLRLSLQDLKTQFEPVELVAVNQCSGNSRAFFQPRIPGNQLGNGAMGNARWKGVSLKAVLNKAGLGVGAKQVTFKGLDAPALPATPPFIKAIPVEHAMDGEVLLAYRMNDEDLPLLNGYPVRLVVPGYYGTYWIKHLSEISVTDRVFDGFWMSTAYRVPDNDCHCVSPGTAPKATVPISRLVVRSFITSLADGAAIKTGDPIAVRGIAFDGGSGIREVLFSQDGGKSWKQAGLGQDLGKYSFREWKIQTVFKNTGRHELKVRATNRLGQTQPLEERWNPSGYMRNIVETVRVNAT